MAIIAVDPTSPFSGGAILGDRIRMSSLFCDPGVFIRSMATRGSLGGLSTKTKEVCDLLDAFGKDVIIIETVGVGQAELDVAGAAHTTLIVLVPESGDGIQAMKAGLMEIGDIFIVNKSDREGADRLVTEIEMVLEMRPQEETWRPRVVKTVAVQNQGVNTLSEYVHDHYCFLRDRELLKEHREESVRSDIIDLVNRKFAKSIWNHDEAQKLLNRLVKEILSGKSYPGAASHQIWECWIQSNHKN